MYYIYGERERERYICTRGLAVSGCYIDPPIEASRVESLTTGGGHLAVFCVVTWLSHCPIVKVSAWKNAMGAIAKMCENVMGAMGAMWQPWQ